MYRFEQVENKSKQESGSQELENCDLCKADILQMLSKAYKVFVCNNENFKPHGDVQKLELSSDLKKKIK